MHIEQVGPTLSELGATMPYLKLSAEDQRRVTKLTDELKTILDAYSKK